MSEDFQAYVERRAREEQEAADQSTDICAARAHREIAKRFRQMAGTSEAEYRTLPPLRPIE